MYKKFTYVVIIIDRSRNVNIEKEKFMTIILIDFFNIAFVYNLLSTK